jgi:nucleotide-binding universal stress UspA family protein
MLRSHLAWAALIKNDIIIKLSDCKNMKSIIAPTDFSPVSLNAVNYAADLAKEINAELILIHVNNFFVPGADFPLTPAMNYAGGYGAEQLKNLCDKMLGRTHNKIKVRTENIQGIVFNEIEKLCDIEKPFATVMATHSPSTFERVVLHSVTLFAAKNIQAPVLIVPDKTTFHGIKNIGLACDLKTIYREPLEVLRAIISTFHAALHLLHVKKPGEEEHFAELMLTRHYLHEFKPTLHYINEDNIEEGLFSFVKKNALDMLIIMNNEQKAFETTEFKKIVLHPQIPLMALQPEL